MLKKTLIIIGILLNILNKSDAQETPYYQTPDKRKSSHELLNMPNLSSKSISYYFGLTGGLKKSYVGEYLISPFNTNTVSNATGLWEVNIGQNINENFIFETGLNYQKGNLTTTFQNISRQPFVISNEREQYFIPFRIKKRILTIDKISKNAYIYFGIGSAFTKIKNGLNSKQILNFQLPKSALPTDIKSITIDRNKSTFPVNFEAFVELRGKVSERLEISVFIKSIIKKSKDLSNNFSISKINGESDIFGSFEKSNSLTFGLQARINSPKYLKYTSTVE